MSYERFKKYAVQAENVEDFLSRYTKPGRHFERGDEYVKARILSYQEELKKYGYTFISPHDSVTGQVVSYYGKC